MPPASSAETEPSGGQETDVCPRRESNPVIVDPLKRLHGGQTRSAALSRLLLCDRFLTLISKLMGRRSVMLGGQWCSHVAIGPSQMIIPDPVTLAGVRVNGRVTPVACLPVGFGRALLGTKTDLSSAAPMTRTSGCPRPEDS